MYSCKMIVDKFNSTGRSDTTGYTSDIALPRLLEEEGHTDIMKIIGSLGY
jgi:hypothetical protein